MNRLLGRLSPHAYGVLRIVAGVLVAVHGAQTLFGIFGGRQASLVSQQGLAGVIELVCGLLVALGIFTIPAALIASGDMAVAYVQSHLPRGLLPSQNGGELSLIYCLLFLYIATRGTVALGARR